MSADGTFFVSVIALIFIALGLVGVIARLLRLLENERTATRRAERLCRRWEAYAGELIEYYVTPTDEALGLYVHPSKVERHRVGYGDVTQPMPVVVLADVT